MSIGGKIPGAVLAVSFCSFFTLIAGPAIPGSKTKPVNEAGIPNVLPQQRQELGQVKTQAPTVKRRLARARKKTHLRQPDVIYYPTPDETVTEMLVMANIKHGDVLYDLGSGDGRIPITAAQLYGIHAVGIEIDPAMVAIAQERAQKANLGSLVRFVNADLFRTDISAATVVTLYLSNKINLLLRPKLLQELRPGTRVLSHDFHMGDWAPERKIRVPWQHSLYRTIYLWTIPERGKKQQGPGRRIHQLRKL